MATNRTVLIEGISVCTLGSASVVEGIRLINMKKIQLYDILGPGNYNLGLGILMIILGLIYMVSYRRKSLAGKRVVDEGLRWKMLNMIVILAVYSFLIYFIGHLLASIVFFILIFRAVGFKSWLYILSLSIGISISYYIIFVRLLGMVFPHGILIP